MTAYQSIDKKWRERLLQKQMLISTAIPHWILNNNILK